MVLFAASEMGDGGDCEVVTRSPRWHCAEFALSTLMS